MSKRMRVGFLLVMAALAATVVVSLMNLLGGEKEQAAQPTAPDLATGTPYESIAKLPDWSGSWLMDAQASIVETDAAVPLTPDFAAKLAEVRALVKGGGAIPRHELCRPHGLPQMMSQKNALIEFLFAPNHVIVNGENQENLDIFTDGRPVAPQSFDRFHGNSVGHWEGDTLVVESVGFHGFVEILPGVESKGDYKVTQKIRLTGPDKLENQITLSSDRIFTEPYSYTITYTRHPDWEVTEYLCLSKAHAEYDVEGYHPTEAEMAASSDVKPPVRRENHPAANAASLPGGTWTSIAKLPKWFGPWTFDNRPNERNTREYIPMSPPFAAYMEKVHAFYDETGDTISDVYHCRPRGAAQMMKAAGLLFYFVYTPGRVTMVPDHAQTRRYYTDGRGHPDNVELSFNGHSIAHWEGEMLVADTVGFRPDVQMFYSMPSGGHMRMEERIRQIGSEKLEFITTQYNDISLIAPWTYNRTFTMHPDWDLVENYCSEGNRDIDPNTGLQGFDITPPE